MFKENIRNTSDICLVYFWTVKTEVQGFMSAFLRQDTQDKTKDSSPLIIAWLLFCHFSDADQDWLAQDQQLSQTILPNADDFSSKYTID